MNNNANREDELLIAVFRKSFTKWEEKYANLYFALSTHYNSSAAKKILIMANDRSINTKFEGKVLLYKYEDEENEMYRTQVPDISIEDLEKHLSTL